jgi:hypothetical protein
MLEWKRAQKVTAGNRALGVCAPQLWNALPISMRSLQSFKDFKNVLKTHLFTETFKKCFSRFSIIL